MELQKLEGMGGICLYSCFGIEFFYCSGVVVLEIYFVFSKIFGLKKMQYFFFVYFLIFMVDIFVYLDLVLK